MKESIIQNAPPAQLKPIIETGLLEETAIQTQEEKQVILHCTFYVPPEVLTIRIWPTTFLISKELMHKSKLLNAYNIDFYPKRQKVFGDTFLSFTLIFEGLPKDCTFFYLREYTLEKGAFYTAGIQRNESDVYWVDIFAKGKPRHKKK